MKPAIPITDPNFKYVKAEATDLRKRPDWPQPSLVRVVQIPPPKVVQP